MNRMGIFWKCGLLSCSVWIAACATSTEIPERPPAAPPSGESSPTEPGNDVSVLRFIVEPNVGQGTAHVQGVARSFFGRPIRVEPLFIFSRRELNAPKVLLVTGPRRYPEANPWDEAYEFHRLGNLARVEPDLDDSLIAETDRERAAGACFWDDGVPEPKDRAWALRKMKVVEAWALKPPVPSGRRFGEGVRICHPDTGWTDHVELVDAVDESTDWNLIEYGPDARDPLGYRGSPGHGTGTGSVIASRGGVAGGMDPPGTTAPGEITGVAPAATLVPIRTINSVVQFFDSDVARAVDYSIAANCDIISMSLGGRWFKDLAEAIDDAVAKGVIVVAAAGNCVDIVVAPALYANTIAAAASNAADRPWRGSSHGSAVTISAPGEDVWRAQPDNSAPSEPGDGTSFATAEIAGAAALWLAFHGRTAIDAARGDASVQELFMTLLREAVDTPPDWPSAGYGPGILNVKKLLSADLRGPVRRLDRAADLSSMDLLGRAFDIEESSVKRGLESSLFRRDAAHMAERFHAELSDLAIRSPDAFRDLLRGETIVSPRVESRGRVRLQASRTLRQYLHSGDR